MWGCVSIPFGRALAWHARGQRFDPAILHQKSTVLRRKYGAFLFAEADFWGMHSSNCTIHGYEDEHGVWLLPQAAVGWYVYWKIFSLLPSTSQLTFLQIENTLYAVIVLWILVRPTARKEVPKHRSLLFICREESSTCKRFVWMYLKKQIFRL